MSSTECVDTIQEIVYEYLKPLGFVNSAEQCIDLLRKIFRK